MKTENKLPYLRRRQPAIGKLQPPHIAQNRHGEWCVFGMMGTPLFFTFYRTEGEAMDALDLWQRKKAVVLK